MILNIHQKISFAMVTTILMISMYDAVFHFLLWLLHIVFESAEFVLDHLIDYVFEIGNRETEIVVFYIMISLIGGGGYRLYRLLPRWWENFKQLISEQKAETLMQWQSLSVRGKVVWYSLFITLINGWLFLA
jgi:hypothetical protein